MKNGPVLTHWPVFYCAHDFQATSDRLPCASSSVSGNSGNLSARNNQVELRHAVFAAAWLAMVIFRANRLLRAYLEIRSKYDGMYRKDAGIAQG